MLSSALNNRIGNTMAIIAVSQMLMDRIDSLIKINKYDVSSIGITSSLSLTINLAQMIGMSFDEIVDLVSDFLTRNSGSTIKTMDKAVRVAMLTALNLMVSCASSPIISDDLLYEVDEEGKTFRPAAKPMYINLATVDIYNLFSRATPTGDRAEYYYGDVPSGATPSMVWKSGDMDAYIWYAMNMVEPVSEGDKKYWEKLTWDNRNKFFKDYLFNEDLSQYPNGELETYCGEDADGFWEGISSCSGDDESDGFGTSKDRKRIFKIDYIDSINSLKIQLPSDTYGSKKIFGFTIGDVSEDATEEERKRRTFNYERNRTIYDFNKDYIENVRIFYTKHKYTISIFGSFIIFKC